MSAHFIMHLLNKSFLQNFIISNKHFLQACLSAPRGRHKKKHFFNVLKRVAYSDPNVLVGTRSDFRKDVGWSNQNQIFKMCSDPDPG